MRTDDQRSSIALTARAPLREGAVRWLKAKKPGGSDNQSRREIGRVPRCLWLSLSGLGG